MLINVNIQQKINNEGSQIALEYKKMQDAL